jgi:hypothetical protein
LGDLGGELSDLGAVLDHHVGRPVGPVLDRQQKESSTEGEGELVDLGVDVVAQQRHERAGRLDQVGPLGVVEGAAHAAAFFSRLAALRQRSEQNRRVARV